MKRKIFYTRLSTAHYPLRRLKIFADVLGLPLKEITPISYYSQSIHEVETPDFFYEGSDEQNTFLEAAKKAGLETKVVRYEEEYSDADLRAASLLRLIITHDIGTCGYELGTEFDIQAECGICNRGGKQLTPLVIDMQEMRGAMFGTCYSGYVVLRSTARKVIEAAGLTGLSFGEVINRTHDVISGIYQIVNMNQMPEMAKVVTFYREERFYCPHCNRGGMHLRSKIAYPKKVMNDVLDFNETKEMLGNIRAGDRRTMIIVKQSVYEVFTSKGVCDIAWEPVELVDNE